MRTYDVPYVQNNGIPKRALPLDELDLKTIVKEYLCHKSNGLVSTCMKCENRCQYGQKAIDLTMGRIPSAAPQQGIGTLLEKARKEAEQKKKKEIKEEENWYEQAKAEPDPVEWTMVKFGISKTKAKRKIYMYEYNRGMKKKEEKTEEKKEEKEEGKKSEYVQDEDFVTTVKMKLEKLKEERDNYKALAEKFERLSKQSVDQIDALELCLTAFEKKG